MSEGKQDPLNVPMDQVITADGSSESKGDAGQTTPRKAEKIEGSHTQETVDPSERLPDEPKEQNDLA